MRVFPARTKVVTRLGTGMHDAMKRHEIQVLKQAGLTHGRTAEVSGVPKRSVRRIAHEPPVEGLGESASSRHGAGRPSKVDAFRPQVEAILQDEPSLPTTEILHRLGGLGCTAGKSAVYALVARLRPPCQPLLVRFDGLPGEFSQHDFGHVDVCFRSGTKDRVHFFVSRLKYSRWIQVQLVLDEKVESLVRALLKGFQSFGGVPLVAVFDNPKTVVLRRHGTHIEWNKTFGQVALDYRFAPELCSPGRGQEKGSVENAVGFVKGSFFKVRRFHDREDLDVQLADWHREVNENRPCRATGVTPLERLATEGTRLRPLPIPPQDYALHFPVMVGPTAQVEFQGARYSMPPESIGFPATLLLFEERVRIVAGRHRADHHRLRGSDKTSYLPQHRAAMLANVSGERGRLYFKRQRILELGTDAEALLTEIVHRHPRSWKGEVEILFDLLQDFGEQRMVEALAQAIRRRLFGAQQLADLLARATA